MIEAHFKKLRIRAGLSSEEEEVIRGLVAETLRFPAQTILVREGEHIGQSLLCLDGWLARTKDARTGERQILELHVAGDFADLHGFTLKQLDHNLITLSPAKIGLVPHERLQRMLERYPRLAKLYWLMTNIDAALQREWTFSVGRRTATARLAHLFCEIFERLKAVDRVQGDGFDLPLRQAQLSECLGLTPVHINRTLQGLRSEGLVTLENRRLSIHDHARLAAVADFDPAYLHLQRRM